MSAHDPVDPPSCETATVIGVVGDLMFGDQVVTYGYGFDEQHRSSGLASVFEGVSAALSGFDVVVGNFEAVINEDARGAPSVLVGSIATGAIAAQRMRDANIRVASMANNHTMDHGPGQYRLTAAELERAGVHVIGHRQRPWHIIEHAGRPVAVIAASYVPVSAPDPLYWYRPTSDDWERALDRLRSEMPVGAVLAYLHWGNEFMAHPNEEQVEIARALARLGVDAVVGCHSHTVQTAATIDGMPVHFGLGNFVSDYWQARLRRSTVLEVRFGDITDFPRVVQCELDRRGRPHIIREESIELATFDGVVCDRKDIALARLRVRAEYIGKLLANFHRVRGKGEMLRWAWSRLRYVARHGITELRRPNVLYETYGAPEPTTEANRPR